MAARSWGVPPSVLAGRVVGEGQPLWTQEDTDLALALAELEESQCPGCGHDRAVSTAKANTFAFRAEPVKCHACAARDRAADARSKEKGWEPYGVRWSTHMKGGE